MPERGMCLVTKPSSSYAQPIDATKTRIWLDVCHVRDG